MSGCGTPQTPPLQMGIAHGQWATGAVAAMARGRGRAVRAPRPASAPTLEVSALEVMAVVPQQLPAAVPAVHRLGVVHVAQRRLAAGRAVQGRLDRPVRVHAAAVVRLRRHDRARRPRRPTTASTRWAAAAATASWRESVVRPWLEAHTAAEICELGELFRVPVALVGNGRDVLADGPLRRARACSSSTPRGSSRRGSPFLMSASPVRDGRAPRPRWAPTTTSHEAAAPPAGRARRGTGTGRCRSTA